MTTITIDKELLERALEALGFPVFKTAQMLVKRDEAIKALRTALSEPATAPALCWCDEQSIGEPGVSCGDCPTRDYKATAPEQPAWHDAPDVAKLKAERNELLSALKKLEKSASAYWTESEVHIIRAAIDKAEGGAA